MDETVVDTAIAAKRLGLSKKTLTNRRIYGGGPPFLKMGKAVRYRVSDLDAWVAAHVVNSTSQTVAA
ncbi:helix-turn-helix transcriptional regulator [Sphingobium boeckii]|uniref:Excisionase family DNA binding protein n=1 Tax=Sphingobium boeckii TaxID=1082345 RepID=A0A7W9AH86_9SPHN|nr:helix-turn-helix domain-containing protein [Sphingobium boeckii]MBB5685657.1 excisionase family DNA binding protein [Sphingobium boeckii]